MAKKKKRPRGKPRTKRAAPVRKTARKSVRRRPSPRRKPSPKPTMKAAVQKKGGRRDQRSDLPSQNVTIHVIKSLAAQGAFGGTTTPTLPQVAAYLKGQHASKHDIILISDKKYCFVDGELFPHEETHPKFNETVVIISISQHEEIVWSCETDSFEIKVRPKATTLPGIPPVAHHEPEPFAVPQPIRGWPGTPAHSGPAKPSALN